jgi:hypothetical protein
MKNVNCKVVDHVEYCNFDTGFISDIADHVKSDLRTYIEYLDL